MSSLKKKIRTGAEILAEKLPEIWLSEKREKEWLAIL